MKEKTLRNGVTGNYWKIISEHLDRNLMQITWEIALFKDQAASMSGCTHLGLVKQFSKRVTREEALGNRTTLGYSFIQTKADSMVTPITGGAPRVFDTDLAGGISA